jgi:ABC-type uncharacterized transport system fused permease/ATPase subunit
MQAGYACRSDTAAVGAAAALSACPLLARYATILIPSLVLAPEYFAGLIEFGTMTQVRHTLQGSSASAARTDSLQHGVIRFNGMCRRLLQGRQ